MEWTMDTGKSGTKRRGLVVGLLAAILVLALAPAAGAQVFANQTLIKIPATGTQGPATPYPSAIPVSGMTGAITSVTATITGFSHTFPSDVDILLVGPSGQNVVLLADTGGGTDVNNATITFDQAAPTPVPSPIVSGTFRPTNGGAFTGPAPAPPAPYGASLALFNGTVPNGTWNLFVFDDAGGDVGQIQLGWSLNITTNGPTVASFTPQTGPGGTQVVITGTNFTGTTAVRFGGIPATAFTVNSPTTITATVPPNAPSGPISVTTPAGTASSTTPYQVSPPPTITSFTPTAGRVGRQVVITGTNLTGATALTFGGTPASGFAVNSATQITANVPTGAGAGPIAVTTPAGQATSPQPFVVGHRRSVSLSLTRTRGRGTLVATDGFTKCATGVSVELQRRSRGRWREVGSDVTDQNGRFSVASRQAGRFRALARRTTLSSGDTCARARSGSDRRSSRR
jgi:subtilisin-like proprotein convertase family protein